MLKNTYVLNKNDKTTTYMITTDRGSFGAELKLYNA